MDKLSVIIPARNEVFLQKTIDSVLDAAVEDIEVLAVTDGYDPDPPLREDPRVRRIHNPESIGQRQSINLAARLSTGKYIMKLDAHCMVAPGFDKILKEDCKPEWTMVPTMYVLDVVKWAPKTNKKTEYMYVSGPDHMKDGKSYGFRAMYYGKYAGAVSRRPRNDKLIDETMCCMGPGWLMHKDRFWHQGGCDEGHGGWGQQGVEVGLKAWLSGGALMVNKKTWFAHWFRGGEQPMGLGKGFPYKITFREQEEARKYSKDLWLNNKWSKQTRTIEWLVEKFNPPTWKVEKPMMYGRVSTEDPIASDTDRMNLFKGFYRQIHRGRNHPSWMGVPVIKFPSDMMLYQEAIYTNQPDFIVEIGTKYGGSALFFQDMLDLVGKGGKVITVDIANRETRKDPRITYIKGNSRDRAIVEQVRNMLSGKVMVTVDGNHDRAHVKWDLHNYGPMVTVGQYLVAEDCYNDKGVYGPGLARNWFLSKHRGFELTDTCKKYGVGISMGGWLKRT